MSGRLVSWVLQHSKAPTTPRFVLVAVASHARDDGTRARARSKTLADETRLSRSSVRDARLYLEGLGELAMERDAQGHVRRYRVVVVLCDAATDCATCAALRDSGVTSRPLSEQERGRQDDARGRQVRRRGRQVTAEGSPGDRSIPNGSERSANGSEPEPARGSGAAPGGAVAARSDQQRRGGTPETVRAELQRQGLLRPRPEPAP